MEPTAPPPQTGTKPSLLGRFVVPISAKVVAFIQNFPAGRSEYAVLPVRPVSARMTLTAPTNSEKQNTPPRIVKTHAMWIQQTMQNVVAMMTHKPVIAGKIMSLVIVKSFA